MAVIVDVVSGNSSVPTPTKVLSEAVVDVVHPGGTVANVQWGYDFPESPVEGQIWIKVT